MEERSRSERAGPALDAGTAGEPDALQSELRRDDRLGDQWVAAAAGDPVRHRCRAFFDTVRREHT